MLTATHSENLKSRVLTAFERQACLPQTPRRLASPSTSLPSLCNCDIKARKACCQNPQPIKSRRFGPLGQTWTGRPVPTPLHIEFECHMNLGRKRPRTLTLPCRFRKERRRHRPQYWLLHQAARSVRTRRCRRQVAIRRAHER